MKNYLNKGLIYEWFNAGKAAILIGLITWGFLARALLVSNVDRVKYEIARADSSSFYAVNLGDYFILGIIFLAIYIFANGVSKRNNIMFLCSGPYTKKQIKLNELICLFITLLLFIIMYLYIVATVYIKYHELMYIINYIPQIILIEVLRLFLFGVLGILLMLTIDLLFSNSIMAYIGMIGLGIATIGGIAKLFMVISYFGQFERTINNFIFRKIDKDGVRHYNLLFGQGNFDNEQFSLILKGSIVMLIIIGITFFAFNFFEKRSKLETSGKIFSSKVNETIISIYLSVGAASVLNIIFTEDRVSRIIYKSGEYAPLIASDLIKVLSIDIVSIAVISFILFKILKKIIKIVG
ncbi:hypothetical protein [Clostridium saccharoperbutylacetonicum]|uniref:hypothetical protein n=1 Tax=Clostridium saccharoperbutylacetonicum TaxID=36745 RepID=UPI00098392D2|nr:hypothetical protein [Clostridium saccharoperbutylacetonicum]AQR96009.1 hypothetical protein CLSAP_33270 [Clostridium saccharoperbutylacetonicum]NSB31876.1 ABC-2 type transport system permease protein [Clostridium saccharoperbutylacetonicum]